MELRTRSEWQGYIPINIKFFLPIAPIMAILDQRLMQLEIQEDSQMNLDMGMCTFGDHIFTVHHFGQLVRNKSANAHLSI